jgi:hemerythrin
MALQFGIQEIDDQHAEITQLVDGMIAAVDSRSSILDVHYRIVHLYDVTARHFALEESLMRLFHYPQRDAHIALHASVLKKLDELKKLSLRKKDIDWTELDAKTMFLAHIDEHDRDLCRFILAALPAGSAIDQAVPGLAAAAG